jgi:hypothetical protein
MEDRVAKEIADRAMAYSRALDQSMAEVRDRCPDDVFQEYRREAGRVVGYLFTEILAPIWDQYETLAPEWYKSMNRGIDVRQPPQMSAEMRNRLLGSLDDLASYLQSTTEVVKNDPESRPFMDYAKKVQTVLECVASTRSFLESLDAGEDDS